MIFLLDNVSSSDKWFFTVSVVLRGREETNDDWLAPDLGFVIDYQSIKITDGSATTTAYSQSTIDLSTSSSSSSPSSSPSSTTFNPNSNSLIAQHANINIKRSSDDRTFTQGAYHSYAAGQPSASGKNHGHHGLGKRSSEQVELGMFEDKEMAGCMSVSWLSGVCGKKIGEG